MREKTGRRLFEVAGWLLTGSIVASVVSAGIGVFVFMPIAWLIAALSFLAVYRSPRK